MYFNQGFKCPNCGPIPKAKTGNINKVAHNLCPDCKVPVSAWERPLKERKGRCGLCGKSDFKSIVYRGKQKSLRGHILRGCLFCKEVLDSDTETVIKKGELPQ